MRSRRSLSILLLGCVWACDNEATVVSSSNCLDACLDASAEFDLNAQLAIVEQLRLSLDDVRVGLAAYAGTAQSLTGFVQSMVDLNAGMPSGLTYQGAGRYTAQPNANTRVELTFYQPANTSFGAAGDLIDFNLFSTGNYFASLGVKTSASLSLSGVSAGISFTFDGAGPGAQLMGIAAGTSSPIAVDVGGFSRQLSKIIVHATVVVQHATDGSTFAFTVSPEPRAAGGVANSTIPLVFGDFRAATPTLEQVVTLGAANLAMQHSGAAFDGSLKFLSAMPGFAFDMAFQYSASANADVSLSCPVSVTP